MKLLPAPTVNSVTKNLQTLIESLKSVQKEQNAEGKRQADIVSAAGRKRDAAYDESARAAQIEKKISDLLS